MFFSSKNTNQERTILAFYLLFVFLNTSLPYRALAWYDGKDCPPWYSTPFKVKITSNLGMYNLGIHCASKTEELGYHVIYNVFQFDLCYNDFLGNTLYFCRFKSILQNKETAFEVFNEEIVDSGACKEGICDWSVDENKISLLGSNNKYDHAW